MRTEKKNSIRNLPRKKWELEGKNFSLSSLEIPNSNLLLGASLAHEREHGGASIYGGENFQKRMEPGWKKGEQAEEESWNAIWNPRDEVRRRRRRNSTVLLKVETC